MTVMRYLILLGAFVLTSLPVSAQTVPKQGDTAPDLALTELGTGTPRSLADFKGDVVILDFWATWCTPCIAGIPELNRLSKTFADRVRFLSVTYEPEHMVKPFLRKHPMETTVCIDNDFKSFKAYQAWAIPMAVLIDRDGNIASVMHPDYLTSAVIEDLLEGNRIDLEQTEAWPDPEGAEEYFRSLIRKPGE